MRAKGSDYFENSRTATLVQQQYAIENPQKFARYSEHCWGITGSDGPGKVTRRIDGVISTVWRAIGCWPSSQPKRTCPTIRAGT